MIQKLLLLLSLAIFLLLAAWDFPDKNSRQSEQTIAYFKSGADSFAHSTNNLQQAISALQPTNANCLPAAILALKQCRQEYKKIAFFLNYFFPSAAKFYNAAPVVEVEEPTLEYVEPAGLQQIESLLFSPTVYSQKQELLLQAEVLHSSASDLKALLPNFNATDAQILEALRIELVRVITLYLTGYDAPQLKTGISESYHSMASLQTILSFYLETTDVATSPLKQHIGATLQYLKHNPDFDSFNRLQFLTQYALPLQESLGDYITAKKLVLNTTRFLNYEATNIFSKNAFKVNAFIQNDSVNPALIRLGEKLFSETALSGNNSRSCQTCHQPDFFFTDKLPQSPAFNGRSKLKRNAPSLLYSSLQHAQFWDGRVGSLTEQVEAVLFNADEMSGNAAAIKNFLATDSTYKKEFIKAMPALKKEPISTKHVAQALAAFMGTLNPFNSPFDQYVQGNREALTPTQIKGFNIFTGKAQCATCHFMPVFNSVLPPGFALTEYEIIGVPATDNLKNLIPDTDAGRFSQYPVKYYKGAFKTPTVRNAAETAPYMHNGTFKDLKTVMEFYNKGGGHGLGLPNEGQTLSGTPLNLSDAEMDAVIQFMQALTDLIPKNKTLSRIN